MLLKPQTECDSHHAISLLNSDTKVLWEVLARRLEKFLLDEMGKDQNGFIKGRQGFHNVRRVLNILHARSGALDTAILLLDVEKAFHRVEWPYLFEVLPHFGCSFSKWMLYTNPTSEIITTSAISKLFHIHRGTQQCCPLSCLVGQVGQMDHRLSLSVTQSLDRWSFLPTVQINVQKMNVLPNLLYLFQNIPLAAPHLFFKDFLLIKKRNVYLE